MRSSAHSVELLAQELAAPSKPHCKKIFGGYSAQYYHVNADVLANLQEPEAGDGLDLLL